MGDAQDLGPGEAEPACDVAGGGQVRNAARRAGLIEGSLRDGAGCAGVSQQAHLTYASQKKELFHDGYSGVAGMAATVRLVLPRQGSDGIALAPVAVGAQELEVLERRCAAVSHG